MTADSSEFKKLSKQLNNETSKTKKLEKTLEQNKSELQRQNYNEFIESLDSVIDFMPEEKDFSNNYSEIKEIFCKYIKFKPEIKDILEKNYQNITGGNKNILGILCRGTDYSIKKTIYVLSNLKYENLR